MTDFATDLLWEEEKQPALPVPARPHDRRPEEKKAEAQAPVAAAEGHAERLQRVAGNAALAREAEEAAAAGRRLAQAARQPGKMPAGAPAPKPEAAKRPEKKRREEARARAAADPKAAPEAREKAAERQAAETAMAVEAQRLSEATRAAAARAAALARVLADFDADAGKADIRTLALLVESAPPGIAEATARALAQAAMQADPGQRAAMAARIRDELGHRRDLMLARLLADRLAWFVPVPARLVPPPLPPPPAPPG